MEQNIKACFQREWDMLKKPRNPWTFAAGIAVGCMFLDDLPEPAYNTFRDPGAAAMLSIVLADAMMVAIYRGRVALATFVFLPALFLKFCIQPFFWIRDAEFLDLGTLAGAHAILGLLAARNVTWHTRLQCAGAAIVWVSAAVFVAALIGGGEASWLHFYIQVGAARILVPLAFWCAVLHFEGESPKRGDSP